MSSSFTAIAVSDEHPRAEAAIEHLGKAGFEMKNLNIVGKGYHTDEKVEGAVVVGGASELAAALYGLCIKKNSIIQYEADITADNFLVMAHGSEAEMNRAKDVLDGTNPTRMDIYSAKETRELALAE